MSNNPPESKSTASTAFSPPPPNNDWFTSIPYWSAAIAGIIYGTGFLIEYTFLESMGINDPVEGFKAKYVYVGLLCLQFPVSVCLLFVGYFRINRATGNSHSQEPPRNTRAYRSALCLTFLLLFNFYLLTTFARPGTFQDNRLEITTVFMLYLVMLAIRCLEDKIHRAAKKLKIPLEIYERNLGEWARGILLLVALVLTIVIYRTLWPVLLEMFVDAGYLYLGFILIIGMIIWWIDSNISAFRKAGHFGALLLSMGSLLLAFTYLSIIVFANRLYPYIPVDRGGGDYTTQLTSILTFDTRLSSSLPKEIIDVGKTKLQSYPVIILHESSNTLFLDLPHSTNDGDLEKELAKWRRSGPQNKPETIYAISRSSIIGIVSRSKFISDKSTAQSTNVNSMTEIKP